MKKYSLAALVLGAGLAFAPNCASSTSVIRDVSHNSERACTCTPHYLKDIKRPTDPLENMTEKYRAYKSMEAKYPYKTTKPPITGSIVVEREIHDANVPLIFPNYVKQKNGTVRHFHAAGIDILSAKEFRCVVEDQVEYISRAGKLQVADYEGMLPYVLEAQEKVLKKEGILKKNEKLKDMLDEEIPGRDGLKVRDVLFTPEITIQESMPTLGYYFGDFEALGVNYTDSGIIGINPRARVMDYINGKPVTLMHEMTHRNQKLQHSPLMYKVDAELWASLPELAHEDLMNFLHHSYLKDIRKVSKVLFNFDSDLAEIDVTKHNLMMGKVFDENKVRNYTNKVKVISEAVKKTAFEKYLPEFFTHPLYFATLNDFLKDKNATFKLIMYMNYHPTLLGGPEKTRDFVLENEELFERLAREVIWNLKSKRRSLDDDNNLKEIRNTLEDRLKQMNHTQRKTLINTARKFGMPNPTNLNNIDDDLIKFGLRLYKLGIVDFDEENQEVLFK